MVYVAYSEVAPMQGGGEVGSIHTSSSHSTFRREVRLKRRRRRREAVWIFFSRHRSIERWKYRFHTRAIFCTKFPFCNILAEYITESLNISLNLYNFFNISISFADLYHSNDLFDTYVAGEITRKITAPCLSNEYRQLQKGNIRMCIMYSTT